MSTTTKIESLIEQAESELLSIFQKIDKTALHNQAKVLEAFHAERLSEEFFVEKTGYGRNDAARAAIDNIFAYIFGAEVAAVRMQFVSGTHALACAILGNLEPKDQMACLTGDPYDTLKEVIGIEGNEPGSLKSIGASYVQVDVIPHLGQPELKEMLTQVVAAPTKLAYIQKSCGYSFDRPSLSNAVISDIARQIKQINPKCIVLVDNCYGEFVEQDEPTAVGANLVAGSLIKNPGGGLALTGGYLAGDRILVQKALNRLTAPGIGGHLGLTYNQNRLILQGLFLAPSVVSQALKGAALMAWVFKKLGYEVKPQPLEPRFDIIQSIKLGSPEALVEFCRSIQSLSPINAHVTPEPAQMPGYRDPIVMAGGTFIEGSTIELSADGPLRPPYAVFFQGGLTYLHIQWALQKLLEGSFGKLLSING